MVLSVSKPRQGVRVIGFALLAWMAGAPRAVWAQNAPSPAGAEAPAPPVAQGVAVPPKQLSPKDLRQAEEAYLKGARALAHHDFSAAEEAFAQAAQLNPQSRDYAVALAGTREHRLTDLVQRAAQARQRGHDAEADRLLLQAQSIDPENPIVQQHFAPDGSLLPSPMLGIAESKGAAVADTLAGPVQLAPKAGTQSVHLRGTANDVLSQLCAAFGVRATVATPLDAGPAVRLDLEAVDFATAVRTAQSMTHTFSVPLQPTELLFARDTPEFRAQYLPLIEETLFLPGVTQESLTEYANLARNVFSLRVVSAVSSSGSLVLRGDEDSLRHVNATFADLVDGGAQVLLDLTLYEIDRSKTNNIGFVPPNAVGAYSIAGEAQSLIAANQSAINTAIANNIITLTGNTYADEVTEVEYLIATGAVSSTQFTNLLGTLGTYAGAPLLGVYLGSGATFNLSLNSSEARLLETVQLRAGDGQDAEFRAGTRYPIETGIYSSGLSGTNTSALAGLTINGVSVSSLLSQYAGSTSATVPQIQYEDLGLTLKATPQVLRTGNIAVKLDFKIETLGSGSINSLPILNNRQLTSTISIPNGKTALLASQVSRSELGALSGLPGLNDLPGFAGTDVSKDRSHTELIITLTPHVVRNKRMRVTSQRFLVATEDRQPQ